MAGCKSNDISSTTNNDVCEQNFQDCNQNPADGCESNTQLDIKNCGQCGVTCSDTHGKATCVDGRCKIACSSGFDDCNQDNADGCESDLRSDSDNCGSCASVCVGAQASEVCSSSACVIKDCDAGWLDCDSDATNGCETNPMGDPAHCGSCQVKCDKPNALNACKGGECDTSCAANYHDCAGSCVENTAVETCGDRCEPCETAVANAEPTCVKLKCSYACKAGFDACGAECVDLMSDPKNCGACGHDCQGATCAAGECQPLAVLSDAALLTAVAVTDSQLFFEREDAPGHVFRQAKQDPKSPVDLGTGASLVRGQGTRLVLSVAGKAAAMAEDGSLASATVLFDPSATASKDKGIWSSDGQSVFAAQWDLCSCQLCNPYCNSTYLCSPNEVGQKPPYPSCIGQASLSKIDVTSASSSSLSTLPPKTPPNAVSGLGSRAAWSRGCVGTGLLLNCDVSYVTAPNLTPVTATFRANWAQWDTIKVGQSYTTSSFIGRFAIDGSYVYGSLADANGRPYFARVSTASNQAERLFDELLLETLQADSTGSVASLVTPCDASAGACAHAGRLYTLTANGLKKPQELLRSDASLGVFAIDATFVWVVDRVGGKLLRIFR